MATTVTRKGQVTIPKPVRDRLGIEPGARVDFALDADGQVILTKVGAPATKNRFAALIGRAGEGPTTEEIMALTRGEP
jgi:AbrB family looped-hinge helix DNA binding protein